MWLCAQVHCIVGSLGAIGAYTRWALASLRDGVLTAMLLAGFLVFWIGSTPWMLLAGVFIGFSLCALRIKQRARLLLRLRCPDDARSWGGRMAMQAVLQRALPPVVLGALLQVSTPSRVFLGSVLPAFLLIGIVLHRKQHAMMWCAPPFTPRPRPKLNRIRYKWRVSVTRAWVAWLGFLRHGWSVRHGARAPCPRSHLRAAPHPKH